MRRALMSSLALAGVVLGLVVGGVPAIPGNWPTATAHHTLDALTVARIETRADVPPAPGSTPVPAGACTATYQTTHSWPGGFLAQVTVTMGGSSANGWSVVWNLASGQSVIHVWDGVATRVGTAVVVRKTPQNGVLAPGGSTSFGLIGTGPDTAPAILTCTA